MSCKSAIYTAMQTPTEVAVNGVIPLGSLIRRYGCDISLNGNAVNIVGKGIKDIMMSMCPSLYPPRRQGRSLQRSSRTAWLFPVRQLPQMLRLARLLRWHFPLLCVRRVAHPALRCRWY